MAYTPNNWVKGDTITAAKMNHMESGISHAEEYVDRIEGAIDELEAGSLSAVGAAEGTMPVADGEGAWEWKLNPVAEEVRDLKIATENSVIAEYFEKPNTQTSKIFDCTIVSGKKYYVKNNGANNVNVRTCIEDGTQVELVKNGITPGEEIVFNASQNASFIRLYADGAVVSNVSITTTGRMIDEVKSSVSDADNALDAKITDNEKTDAYLISKFGIRRKNKRFMKQVVLPSELNGISPLIDVITDGWNYYHNYNIDSYKVSGGATYYVSPFGTATPANSSPSSPTTVYQIIHNNLLDGSTIYFTDGIYADFTRTTAADHDITASCNLIAMHPGNVVEIQNASTFPSFTSSGNGVYTATRSNVVKVFQPLDGEIVPLNKVENASDCGSQGTWHLNSENLLTVHLFDDVEPSSREKLYICLNYGVSMLKIAPTGNADVYVEGISFVGGTPSSCEVIEADGKTVNFYAKDCKFYGAYDSNLAKDAVSIKGANGYFVNCEAMYSSKDGFNYHKNGDNIPQFIEIDCVGANNGLDGVAEATEQYYQNGSTAHDGAVGLRIGGYYYNNYGGNVADVHQDTTTVNIGCTAFDSMAPASNVIAQADFVAQQAGAKMYLIGCRAFGSISSVYAVENSTISVKTSDLEHEPAGAGTIID